VARPQHVLFDAVGTLIYPLPKVAQAYRKVALEFAVDVEIKQIARRFREAIQIFHPGSSTSPGDELATSESGERARWQGIVNHVLQPPEDVADRLFESLWAHFGEAENWRLFDDVRPCLAELSRLDLSVGIVSNFDRRLFRVTNHWLPKWKGPIFISSEVGFAKPARNFYENVTRQLAASPEEILIVGDDWENDVAAPKHYGWQAIWLNRGSNGAQESGGISGLLEVASRFADD